MFKRVVWFGAGAVAGSASTVWAQRKVKAQMDKAKPAHLATVATDATRRVGATIRDAVSEGREAANQREAELRDKFASRPPPPRLRAVPGR